MPVPRHKIIYFPLFFFLSSAAVFVPQQYKHLCVDYSCHQHLLWGPEEISHDLCPTEKSQNQTLGPLPLPNSIKTVGYVSPNQPRQGAAKAKAAAVMETWERCKGSHTAQGPPATAQTLPALPAFMWVKSSLKETSEQPLPQPESYPRTLCQRTLSKRCKSGW